MRPVHSLALPASRTRQPFFLLRWALSLLLLAALLLPGLARAVPITLDVSAGNIVINTTAPTPTYTVGGGAAVGYDAAADNLIITGTTTTNTVAVNGTGEVNITLSSANIQLPSSCAFCIAIVSGSGATVNLTLTGDNTLTSGSSFAGLGALAGATLNISGAGSLTATGGSGGGAAGIGGSSTSSGGNITINSGTITATSGLSGAGIGGGSGGSPTSGNGGTITINGGDVTAKAIGTGAGIGGGGSGNGGDITIAGGTVNATGSNGGAGIGGGSSGAGGTIAITGGTVDATGGSSGAGIGGGTHGDSGDITISGGTVEKAEGHDGGAGIGSGYFGAVGSITITGDANVTASAISATVAYTGAGIGSGGGSVMAAAGTIKIDTTGTVSATGGTTSGVAGLTGAPIGQGDGIVSGAWANGAGIAPVTDPTDQSAVTGDNASFSVTVTPVGTTLPAIAYQWQQSTDGGATWTNAAGASATTDTLNLTAVTTAMSGYQYRAVVTVTNVGASSSITYTTHAATLTVAAIVITIDTQPAASTTVTQGFISGSLSVAASVSNGATPTYQWYSNTTNSNSGGTPIGGATGASFTIPTTLAAGTYYYYCVASSPGAPSMASSVAVVTVNAAVIAPVIIAPLGGALTGGVVGMGYSATLAASGTAPITWALASGSSLPPGLTLNGTTGQISGTPTTAGPYSFSITASNGAGSDTAALSLQILPAAAGQPAAAVPTLDAAALALLALALAGLAGLGRKRGG